MKETSLQTRYCFDIKNLHVKNCEFVTLHRNLLIIKNLDLLTNR